MTKILIPAQLTTYRPLSDKSFNLTFNTQIPNAEQKMVIDALHQQVGFLMFKDSQVEKAEEEIFDSVEADINDLNKTPSKRLRAVLYKNYEQEPEGFEDFKKYYASKMEKIISHYKGKLED